MFFGMLVAIAYHLQKTPYVFPILGGRKIENLHKNIEALQITLSQEQITFLESALPFDAGFPNWLIVSPPSYSCELFLTAVSSKKQGEGTGPHRIMASSAEIDFWPKAQPIHPKSA